MHLELYTQLVMLNDIIGQFAGSLQKAGEFVNIKEQSLGKLANTFLAPPSTTSNAKNILGKLTSDAWKASGGIEGLKTEGLDFTGNFASEGLKGFKGLDMASKLNLGSGAVGLAHVAVGKSDYGGGSTKVLSGLGAVAGGPVGLALSAGAMLNDALGSTSGKTGDVRKVMTDTGNSYAGLNQRYTESKARDEGKKTSLLGNLFGRKKRDSLSTSANNKRMNELVKKQAAAESVGYASQRERDSIENNAQTKGFAYDSKMAGNNSNLRTLVAKHGAKLPITMNVIPDGALHARKHNLDIAEGITNKGIPVISHSDGGEIKQHAEIEVNEIVLRIEATNFLEDLEKKYRETEDKKEKDSIAVEAGKYFAQELFENTNDNTGLIEQI